MNGTIDYSFLAVGDVSFRGRRENEPSSKVFKGVDDLFQSFGLVVANLESPLVNIDSQPVPGKCTLRGDVSWAKVLKNNGIGLVSVANNHMMDYGEAGLFSTIEALKAAGILYVGAGNNKERAQAPVFIEIAGKRVGFLGRSSVEVSSPCYADKNKPGVAFLEIQELLSAVAKCRASADLVVVMMHWGMEHYHYPSPQQRYLAQEIVSAGANIILGHHPHVLQGEEMIKGALISYSSGNFLFDEFPWSISYEDGTRSDFQSKLTPENRQGVILQISKKDDLTVDSRQVFTIINQDGTVSLDKTPERMNAYVMYGKRLKLPFYDLLWQFYSAKREWDLRLKTMLSPRRIVTKLHKIRPRHFKELVKRIRRSARVSSGKSTNPYDG